MKITFEGHYTPRKSGGIFLGIRMHFPCTLCNENTPNYTWRNITLNVGLLIYTVNIHINYAQKHVNFN